MTEARIQHAVLVERHGKTHGHASDELRTRGAGIDDASDREDAEHTGHPDFTGVLAHMHLGELSAEGMHREPLLLGHLRHIRTDFRPDRRRAAMGGAESTRSRHYGRTPGGDARGSSGDAGGGEIGVADLEPHRGDRTTQRIGRYLGQGRPSARAEIGGTDAHGVALIRVVVDRRAIARQRIARIRRARDTHADPPAVPAASSGARIARVPAETARALSQAPNEVAPGPWFSGFRIARRLVARAELDGIESASRRELIHRHLAREHAGRLAGCPHP